MNEVLLLCFIIFKYSSAPINFSTCPKFATLSRRVTATVVPRASFPTTYPVTPLPLALRASAMLSSVGSVTAATSADSDTRRVMLLPPVSPVALASASPSSEGSATVVTPAASAMANLPLLALPPEPASPPAFASSSPMMEIANVVTPADSAMVRMQILMPTSRPIDVIVPPACATPSRALESVSVAIPADSVTVARLPLPGPVVSALPSREVNVIVVPDADSLMRSLHKQWKDNYYLLYIFSGRVHIFGDCSDW